MFFFLSSPVLATFRQVEVKQMPKRDKDETFLIPPTAS